MKLSFESNLQYQQDAIQSIVGLFEGQPDNESISGGDNSNLIQSIENNLILSEEQILLNLQAIQKNNDIELSDKLDGMNFSVEMETGTGKTYVYLRTIYELNKTYGFKKFVIVVPSIAIREGVKKTLNITCDHFQSIYDKTPLSYNVYDGSRISSLRSFATNNRIEVLVINIDSFAKDENIINKLNDKLSGQRPIEFIRATNPIVIIDEPQNMETEKRINAIKSLNPLCTLRYSATHVNQYNLTYSLNPVKAYDLGLVKQIEVDSVMADSDYNNAYVVLEAIVPAKTKITAKVSIHTNDNKGNVKKKTVTVKNGDDLYKLSNERSMYRNGYVIEGIDNGNKCISFANGHLLYLGESQGDMGEEVMKFQIRKTVEEHLKKERLLNKQGIKVLSLFFIDKVANYRQYDASGNTIKGRFAEWFEEIYKEYITKPAYRDLDKFAVEQLHNGYFSQDKGKVKDTKGDTKADYDTYNLIMKDKERLLDIDEPLRFIFSHSALREGWDNPNVFQICTLNETRSEIKKRQEIGRGLRLAVNGEGHRVYDQNINRLTIIANESYEDFASALQSEIANDCGISFDNRVKNKADREKINYRKGFEADPRFLEIWERIKHQTTYRVSYDTKELIKEAIECINGMEPIEPLLINNEKVRIVMAESGIKTKHLSIQKVNTNSASFYSIPDIVGGIQAKVELTRSTIRNIVKGTDKKVAGTVVINPQLFIDRVSQAIRQVLHKLMIDGIKYHRLGSKEYEMTLFESKELEAYLNNYTFTVKNTSKTIYDDIIPLDSSIENQFARDCETSEQIQFYFKLPSWFKIPTPIGEYNPDWAIVFEEDKKLYFVAETKSTGINDIDISKLRQSEQFKIACAKKQ